MFGDLTAERAAIEMTYEDTATISREQKVIGANHITTTNPALVYEGVACALSYSGSDSSQQTRAQNEVDYDAVIFAAPELLVLPGDQIMLKRLGRDDPTSQRILSFSVVGRPALYPTHQQIKVKDSDLA